MDFYWVTKKEKIVLDREAHKDLRKKFSLVGSNKNGQYWEYDNGVKIVQVGIGKRYDLNFKSDFKKLVL